MAKDYRNIDGLLKTIELMRPSDAVDGQITKNIGFSLYPRTISNLESLQAATGITSRSYLMRMIIDFAGSNKSELMKFLEESAELKAG